MLFCTDTLIRFETDRIEVNYANTLLHTVIMSELFSPECGNIVILIGDITLEISLLSLSLLISWEILKISIKFHFTSRWVIICYCFVKCLLMRCYFLHRLILYMNHQKHFIQIYFSSQGGSYFLLLQIIINRQPF